VPALASTGADYGGSLSSSGLTLAFYSNRGGDLDLYLAKRSSTGSPWGTPTEVSELSTPSEEGGPQLDPTERVLFFFSTRPGGKGDRDLWMATRTSSNAPFGAPTPIVELNTAAEESDLWISPDLRTIYFGSCRGGNLDLDLYMATR
jgi:Tol biopolymer transport system component